MASWAGALQKNLPCALEVKNQDTASHNYLSSSNRDSILVWRSHLFQWVYNLRSARAPHIGPQLGHPCEALSGNIPRATFPFVDLDPCHGVTGEKTAALLCPPLAACTV